MNFPLNVIIFGAIVLFMILILSYDLRNYNQKCQYKNNCSYPYCDCFNDFKNE